MRVRKPQRRCFFIHQVGKAFHAAANGDGNRLRRVICALQEQTVEQVAQRHFLARLQIEGRTLHADGSRRNHHFRIRIALLNGDKRCHDFRCACHAAPCVGILRKHKLPRRRAVERRARR